MFSLVLSPHVDFVALPCFFQVFPNVKTLKNNKNQVKIEVKTALPKNGFRNRFFYYFDRIWGPSGSPKKAQEQPKVEKISS